MTDALQACVQVTVSSLNVHFPSSAQSANAFFIRDCNARGYKKLRKGFPKGRLFLVPVSPPVHFEGVENRNFFFRLDVRFCEQHLSERAVL